ncbi:MAG TPA: hypothetical protein VHX44_03655, partial [Planctomycetota bacterium]|nr:hypothetical protein [Planctomycetota bacterium]
MLTADRSQLLHDPLAGFITDLPPLSTSASSDLREVVINALRRRDHTTLKEILDEADILRPEVALRAVWLPLALGIDAWDAAGEPLIDGRPLGRTVRAQARAALVSMPELPVSRWLIPSTLHDATAAHLAALVFSFRGMGARVWTWFLSPFGPAPLVGDAGS